MSPVKQLAVTFCVLSVVGCITVSSSPNTKHTAGSKTATVNDNYPIPGASASVRDPEAPAISGVLIPPSLPLEEYPAPLIVTAEQSSPEFGRKLDLAILSVRSDNHGAEHVPVEVRVIVPRGKVLRLGILKGYLTNRKGEQIPKSEVEVKLVQYVPSSISVAIPRPSADEGEYVVHVTGQFWLQSVHENSLSTSETRHASSSQPVRFDPLLNCKNVADTKVFDENKGCAFLFEGDSMAFEKDSHHLANEELLNRLVKQIESLCEKKSLRSVQLAGWASVTRSPHKTNEELALGRSNYVKNRISRRWPATCNLLTNGVADYRVSIDPNAGRDTIEFDKDRPGPNQCVEVRIQRHECPEKK